MPGGSPPPSRRAARGSTSTTSPATADSYYSERWAEILGFRLEELPPAQEVPTWFARRVHPEDRAEYALARSELLAGSQSRLVVEVRVARKDGSWIAVT